MFLPYGISDHSPAILVIPQAMQKRNKSSRFANYVADKNGFHDLMAKNWNVGVEGHDMYRLVKKIKSLKPHLNKFNWSNGNLFDKVVELRKKLHDIQGVIDQDPHNSNLREESQLLIEYKEVVTD